MGKRTPGHVEELYRSQMTPEIAAEAILALDWQVGQGRHIDGTIDAAAFSDVGMGGGRADRMNSLGCHWQPSEKGQGSRIAGKSAVHARLALQKDGNPGLVIFRNCRNLIRTLPSLPYSKTQPEDVASNTEDHAYEGLRIGLTKKFDRMVFVRLGGL